MNLWDQLCSPAHLTRAWERVRTNRGRPGTDGVCVAEFETKLQENLCELSEQLANESYRPSPVLQITFQDVDKKREIGISTVRDRVVQQVLYLLLSPLYETEFLDCSYAYRPGRSPLMAVDAVSKCIASGKRWVLETDIKDFRHRCQ